MKKIKFGFIIIGLLLGCTNKNLSALQNAKIKNISGDSDVFQKVMMKNNQDILNYIFSNDTICQQISILLSKSKNQDIPEKIEFILTWHDKLERNSDLKYKGIAHLTSSNESFLDKSDDEGVYFAADYLFVNDIKIKIRLDVENFEACVVFIDTSNSKKHLGVFSNYVKKYPIYDVMKKGNCAEIQKSN